jgi:hypothetical protein
MTLERKWEVTRRGWRGRQQQCMCKKKQHMKKKKILSDYSLSFPYTTTMKMHISKDSHKGNIFENFKKSKHCM